MRLNQNGQLLIFNTKKTKKKEQDKKMAANKQNKVTMLNVTSSSRSICEFI